MTCCICRQPIALGEAVNTHNLRETEHATRRDCVRATAGRCAEKLEREGVLLAIVPNETRHDHTTRYAIAMAVEIRREFGLEGK